jgi:hypothetical protein
MTTARTAARVAAKFGPGNAKKPKGYAQGGSVLPLAHGRAGSETDEDDAAMDRVQEMQRQMQRERDLNRDPQAPDELGGYKSGGKIKRVSGKPVGKDDGVIAAQKGEYVVRKAAAKKYGTKKLGAVNRGAARISAGKK